MSILCYITKRIEKDATSHGKAKSVLEKFAADVEKRQALSGFDHFPPPCLSKKKIFGYNFRMIAAEKRIGEHLIVVFLRLIVRGSNDYATFLRDPAAWAVRHYEEEIGDEQLADWVAKRTQTTPPPLAPELSAVEKTFLWTAPYADQNDDIMVCETHAWVESIRESRVADRLVLLPELILQVLDLAHGEVHLVRSQGDKRLALLAFNEPGRQQCVLLSASYEESDEKLLARGAEWQDKLCKADAATILRYSRRSYPSLICCENDMWMTVQRDPQANLALSPEEAEILRSSNVLDPQRPAFPLFINGRAGSGKSTLLQYLFAECYLRWASQPEWPTGDASRPLYFASSGELLKVAKEVVRGLLSANHAHLLARKQIDARLLDGLGNCFQTFLQFMRSSLGDDAEDRFPSAAYVSYARFRRLWTERFGREKRAVHEYGPQISWHVIRGLIKGMSVDDLLDKDEYDDLPEDERTVSRQVYETVYDRVWKAWYDGLCSSGDAWDSQDLVRFLIDDNRLPVSHAATFCDEAQDFTRLELEAIYRCSLFSDRQIDLQSIKRVPFIFAGDPFQTLNPTGFRWESVRAAFTERILRSLYRYNSRADVPQLNYQELTFNYRSSARIVFLCNSIQAVRASLFDHRSLSPQNTWQLGEDVSAPMFFEKGDSQMESALREQTDLVLIVPCEEGEEIEYVANDSYLKEFVQADDDGTPRNVLSAARAKGLEFLRVALYGWSARDEARTLSRMMRSSKRDETTVDERLGLEYFMNNLYVAASRARRRLFVIDDRESRDGLWWFAADDQNLSQIIENLPQRGVWMDHAGMLMRGVPESFSEDRDDPRAIAERFEKEGLSKEDSYLLKQASLQYTIAKMAPKAHECRAIACLFENRFKEAGENFQKAGQVEKAIDAYWQGQLYADVTSCTVLSADFAKLPRCRMSAFLTSTSHIVRECRSMLEHILAQAGAIAELRTDLRSTLWKNAMQGAVQKSLDWKDKSKVDVSPEDAIALADLILQLERLGVHFEGALTVRLFFAAQKYEDVVKRIGHDDGSDLYRDATALMLIDVAGPPRKYDSEQAKTVAEYYFRQGDYESASQLYREVRDSERLLECLRLSAQRNFPAVDDNLKNTLTTLIDNAEWASMISLVINGRPLVATSDKWTRPICSALLEKIRQERLIFKTVVPALAQSTDLSGADSKSQQVVSEFLAIHVISSSSGATWQDDLSREVAGAAIERAGKDIDALRFYENWGKSRVSSREKEYADRRWVVCKLRQATRTENDGQPKRARNMTLDAGKVMEKHGWSENDVPETFPDLQFGISSRAIDAQESKESQTAPPRHFGGKRLDEADQNDRRGRLGSLTYRVIASKGWINIEADDGLCARVLVRARKITSEDVAVNSLEEGRIECPDWNLLIQWLSDDEIQLKVGSDECKIVVSELGTTDIAFGKL